MAEEQIPFTQGFQALIADLPVEVREAMAVYRPHRLSAQRWTTVREAVLSLIAFTAPPSVEAFHKQMSPLIQFAIWTHQSGHVLTRDWVTAESVETWREVEHQRIAKGDSTFSKATVNDYVSRMRLMGPLINPDGGWAPKPGRVKGGVGKALRDPYPDTELARLWSELQTMPEGLRKEQATAIWLMGLGFGPTPGEMAAMTGSMIAQDAGGVWADIPGKTTRRVPVAEPYASELWQLANAAGNGKLLVIPAKHKNALGETCRTITLGRKTAPLSPQRLRITWMVHRLRAGADPRTVSTAAGLVSLTSVMELLRFLPAPEPGEQNRLLRLNMRADA